MEETSKDKGNKADSSEDDQEEERGAARDEQRRLRAYLRRQQLAKEEPQQSLEQGQDVSDDEVGREKNLLFKFYK